MVNTAQAVAVGDAPASARTRRRWGWRYVMGRSVSRPVGTACQQYHEQHRAGDALVTGNVGSDFHPARVL